MDWFMHVYNFRVHNVLIMTIARLNKMQRNITSESLSVVVFILSLFSLDHPYCQYSPDR
uniref:Uncharacterized protein n=1 Tax=Anguilla anguilla TaxID=7936 RepID=A0A0E9W9N0_ANGAN